MVAIQQRRRGDRMRILRSLAMVSATVLLLALSALADCSAPKNVKELQDCWQQLWASDNQFDSLMQLYADDATLLRSSGGRFVGRTEIKGYWEHARNTTNVKFSFPALTPVEKGELGYDSGSYDEDRTGKNDNTKSHEHGGYLLLAEKSKDKWLIVQQVFVVIVVRHRAQVIQQ
jgi:ketosteroid isomerase-like protein